MAATSRARTTAALQTLSHSRHALCLYLVSRCAAQTTGAAARRRVIHRKPQVQVTCFQRIPKCMNDFVTPPEIQTKLHSVARKIWNFFDSYVTAQEHWLPPDNIRIEPGHAI